MSNKYEDLATKYAEKYGIVQYEQTGNTLTHKEVFPMEGLVYTVQVNLDTFKEISRTSKPIAL